MKDYAQLYDDELDYERDIETGLEQLCELRLKMYREKDTDILKEITLCSTRLSTMQNGTGIGFRHRIKIEVMQ